MKPVYLLLTLFLAGCWNVKPEEKVVYVTKEVQVPIKEKCSVVLPAEPKWATEQVMAGASLFEKFKAILVELEQRRDYQGQVAAEAKRCE